MMVPRLEERLNFQSEQIKKLSDQVERMRNDFYIPYSKRPDLDSRSK